MLYLIYDLILIGIVVLCILQGWKNGFLSTLLSAVAWVAAFAAAALLHTPAAQWIYDTLLEERAVSYVAERIPEGLVTAFSPEGLNAFMQELAASLHISPALLGGGQTVTAAPDTQVLAQSITESYLEPFAVGLLGIIAALVIFAAVLLLLRLLTRTMTVANHIPLVGGLNRFLGGLLGALQGAVTVWLFCMALEMLINLTGARWTWLSYTALSHTYLTRWLMSLL